MGVEGRYLGQPLEELMVDNRLGEIAVRTPVATPTHVLHVHALSPQLGSRDIPDLFFYHISMRLCSYIDVLYVHVKPSMRSVCAFACMRVCLNERPTLQLTLRALNSFQPALVSQVATYSSRFSGPSFSGQGEYFTLDAHTASNSINSKAAHIVGTFLAVPLTRSCSRGPQSLPSTTA